MLLKTKTVWLYNFFFTILSFRAEDAFAVPEQIEQFQDHVWLLFWIPCHFALAFVFPPVELKRRWEHVYFVAHSPLGFKAGQSGRDGECR